MANNVVPDPTDKGTLRPNDKALRKKGDAFYPMNLPDFDHEIRLPDYVSPDDPISLFTIYYPPKIMGWIVHMTNSHIRYKKHPNLPHARWKKWVPTTLPEIYTYFAIRIYINLIDRNEIADYWESKNDLYSLNISKHIARNRFQELYIRVRLSGAEARGPYQK